MTVITQDWLRAHGVGGPDEDLALLAEKTEAALELRVGTSIAERLTDQQLDEFETLMENGTDEERTAWMDEKFPDYPKIVGRETARLKRNIAASPNPTEYIRNLK